MAVITRSAFAGLVLSLVLSAAPVFAAVTYSDSNPVTSGAGGNWAPVVSSGGGLYVLSTGNGYSYYDTTASPFTDNQLVIGFNHYEAANVYWGVGASYTPASVDPSTMGGIGSVDYTHEARKGSLDGVATAILLIQGGKYYRSDFTVIPPSPVSGYQVYSGSGLTAADFGEFSGTSYGYGIPADGRANFASNPDFSAGGAPISFGWLGHFQSGAGGYGSVDPTLPATSLASPGAGDSNVAYLLTTDFSITFNEVPEPSSALLVGAAILPLLLRRRSA